MNDFPTQTLVIDFTEPMSCLNSLAGSLSAIGAVGNHYLSPPLWTKLAGLSIDALKQNVCTITGRDVARASFLYTGARMDNVSVQKMKHGDMIVYTLVTAGVKGNATRASIDEGRFCEPGTINVIILTNMQLAPRAQTRAVISATEAKSAALQDLDIRSSYSPGYQATGTGTDEVLVVEGRGQEGGKRRWAFKTGRADRKSCVRRSEGEYSASEQFANGPKHFSTARRAAD